MKDFEVVLDVNFGDIDYSPFDEDYNNEHECTEFSIHYKGFLEGLKAAASCTSIENLKQLLLAHEISTPIVFSM